VFAWNLQLLDGKAVLPASGGGEIKRENTAFKSLCNLCV